MPVTLTEQFVLTSAPVKICFTRHYKEDVSIQVESGTALIAYSEADAQAGRYAGKLSPAAIPGWGAQRHHEGEIWARAETGSATIMVTHNG